MYPRLQLPVGEMRKRIFNRIDANKIVSINSAVLTVEAVKHSSLSPHCRPDALMLIREVRLMILSIKIAYPERRIRPLYLLLQFCQWLIHVRFSLFLDKEIMTDSYNFTELNVLLVPVNVC